MAQAESDIEAQSWVAAFWGELRKLGWTEGRDIEIDTRWASGDVESMKRFAKDFVALQPDLIVTISTPATAAMLQQTKTIPIIFVLVAVSVERMRTFAKELVELQPDVILAGTTPVTAALQRETSTIPIVFVLVSDPVGAGFVAGLPRPGGNITGFSNIEGAAFGGKWLRDA